MKTFRLVIIAFFLVNVSFSQDKTRDEVLQLIADDSCLCIKNDTTLLDSSKTMKQKQMALGLCLLKSYNIRKKESSALADKDVNDFEALAEEVGFKMGTTCGDVFIDLFSDDQLGAMLDESDDDAMLPLTSTKDENDLNIEAKLLSIDNEVVSSFTVSDAFGKTHSFLISQEFEGYKLLVKSNIKQNFRIFYKEADYFDLSERRYVKKKIIKYLEKI
ncbi:hypothetical protein [Psychroserpens mesophilus]|uniref:hypothetical protein n=1 Tax=Psychroserpens mesophilus TaxID=325473 RepID=UPI003D65FA19